MKKNHTDDDELDKDDESGGDGSESGGSGTGGLTPSYYELLGINADEAQLTELAAQALFEQRISIKSQGYDVTALSKMQQLRNKLLDPNVNPNAEMSGSGLALDEHPELADLGGDVDPNTIVLPESEAAAASNDPQLQLKLRQRAAAKFGVGSGVSLQTMQEEYKKKMELRSRPRPDEPEPTPRYRPAPRYTPK